MLTTMRSILLPFAAVLALVLIPEAALAQVGAPKSTEDQSEDGNAEGAEETATAAEESPSSFKILGQDPWMDVGIQAAAMFGGATLGAGVAGGVLAFATYATGFNALTSADIMPLAFLALGGVAAVALPPAGVLLAATLTGANWMRGLPAALLAAAFGAIGLIPGAIVGGIAGTALAGALAIGEGDQPVGLGANITPLAVGAAVGGGMAAATACLFGAAVGFSGGLTADYMLHDGFAGYEGDE